MSHELIVEQVDIFQLPALDTRHTGGAGTQVTIGDLHGNAMKLMFMLVKHGIATNIDKADYNRLVTLYKTPTEDLTKEHLDEFNQILSKLEFNKDSLVRLIGDELADRGNNDYFTLKILQKLSEHNVPVEIIVSNHSIEFIEACEKQNDFHPPMLRWGHASSMQKLQCLVEKGIVTREEIVAIANKNYKPTLRAISYSLSEDKQEITIYSHAGIGLNTIKNLTQKLKVEYQDATASELAQTIDKVNAQFQKHVQNNTVNTLYTRDKMFEGYCGEADLSDAPFEFIMWNRLYHHINRPAVHSGYKVNFAHGHDSSILTKNNIYNLDNNLGKAEYMNKGTYTVLYSQEAAMAPVMKPVKIEQPTLQQQESIDHSLSEPQPLATNEQPQVNQEAAITPVMKPVEIEQPDLQQQESADHSLSEPQPPATSEQPQVSDEEIKPTVITLTQLDDYFLAQLKEIKKKEKDLRDRGYTKAADKAKILYETVLKAHTALIEKKIDIPIFKERCTKAIDKARSELETHRGWKQVLGNLALAVIGLGVLYLIAGLIHKATTGKFLFFKTDSADKVDQLEKAINSFNKPTT